MVPFYNYLFTVIVLLFVGYQICGFRGLAKPQNLVSNEKEVSIDVYTENHKTNKSRFHELGYLRIKVLSQYFKCK